MSRFLKNASTKPSLDRVDNTVFIGSGRSHRRAVVEEEMRRSRSMRIAYVALWLGVTILALIAVGEKNW